MTDQAVPVSCQCCGVDAESGGNYCLTCSAAHDRSAWYARAPIAEVNAAREADFVAAMQSIGPDQVGLYVHIREQD